VWRVQTRNLPYRVNCPFYFKIGACRHGDRCSRQHNKPAFSQTVLLQNFYQVCIFYMDHVLSSSLYHLSSCSSSKRRDDIRNRRMLVSFHRTHTVFQDNLTADQGLTCRNQTFRNTSKRCDALPVQIRAQRTLHTRVYVHANVLTSLTCALTPWHGINFFLFVCSARPLVVLGLVVVLVTVFRLCFLVAADLRRCILGAVGEVRRG
jgi:hypothetical protein